MSAGGGVNARIVSVQAEAAFSLDTSVSTAKELQQRRSGSVYKTEVLCTVSKVQLADQVRNTNSLQSVINLNVKFSVYIPSCIYKRCYSCYYSGHDGRSDKKVRNLLLQVSSARRKARTN